MSKFKNSLPEGISILQGDEVEPDTGSDFGYYLLLHELRRDIELLSDLVIAPADVEDLRSLGDKLYDLADKGIRPF